jgi:choline transporter-like protein 2/4/5
MWFWTSQFIIAIGQLIIALSITCWYFTRDKGDIGTGTPIWAARNATWYHVGTAAFGSLIIAIVSTIQVIITYLERKAERSGNVLAKAVLRCINCCVYCLGKFIKFLSKNVYILVAIHGHGFCSAAMAAVVILTRNVLRVSAVNMVAGFVLMLGKIMVPCVTTLLCFLFVRDMNTNGIILPMLLVFILSYFVSCMFQEIFGMSIETILLCFIADEQMYPIEKRFADGSLQDAITKTAQQASASAKVHVEDSGSSAKEVQIEQPAASGGELL